MKLNFLRVYQSIRETGGATYNFNIPELNPTNGYAVALPGYGHTFPIPENLNEFQDIVQNYLDKRVLDILTDSRSIYLGFWIENGLLYIDLTEVIDDLSMAIIAGIERKELAIWDNYKLECIYL